MTETQTLNWDDIDVDEEITEADQKMSDDISVETPVGKFICTVEDCTAQENAMSAYTCVAANLKLRIDKVLELEQPVKDDKGNIVKRNGEVLHKKMTVDADKAAGVNALYSGRFIFDAINLAHPKEKDAMKKRRLFVAKKMGIISPQATSMTARDWAGSPGRRVIIETEWNSWKDKNTGELKKNVRVGWGGYDFAPQADTESAGSVETDDFSNI